MSRVAFSVRFPGDLAAVLDQIAERGRASRSDVVETAILAAEAEDRAAIINTAVGSPTEKRNLRLSAEALQRLKQLAEDMAPSDFLRRMIAYAVNREFPEWQWQHTLESSEDTDREARPRSHYRQGPDDDPRTEIVGNPIGLIVLGALVVLGVLVSFVVWLIYRLPEGCPEGRDSCPRGQLSDGHSAADDA